MVVNAEDEVGPNRGVDEFDEVLFPRGESQVSVTSGSCAGIMAFPVDNDTVCSAKVHRFCFREKGLECGRVDVVRDEKGAEVDIIIITGRPIDDKGPEDPISVLVRC